jgi:hypothetical protein
MRAELMATLSKELFARTGCRPYNAINTQKMET